MSAKLLKFNFILAFLLMIPSQIIQAKMSDFKDGPVIVGYGKHAPVASKSPLTKREFKVAFDVGKAAKPGELNRQFNSSARFINMQAAAGVPKENIHLALVVHGKASFDLLNNHNYQQAHQLDNKNQALIQSLLANNVRVILCGQSAAAYDIALEQLITGSEIELSAMTAHALLQQQGYSLNPF
ncbi:DsrE family protein [Paraglaciecola aestuariivivens]